MQSHFSSVRVLNLTSLIANLIAFLSVVWIVVPAPAYNIWIFSVAASEWSLWLGMLALGGTVCGLLLRFLPSGLGWPSIVSLVLGGAALLISLYPLLSVVSTARVEGVSLSPVRYFEGLQNLIRTPEHDAQNVKTYMFAQVDGQELRLDVHLPTTNTDNIGAGVIVVHGGSWKAGERNDFPQWNQWLSEQGFAVFDVDYRINPQPNYLTAAGDVKCAIRWIKNHAAEFRIDSERLVLFGRSAGGQLALIAAYSAADERLPSSCVENQTSGDVRAVVSVYGVTDLIWSYDNPANQCVIDGPKTLSDFVGGDPRSSENIRERFALASPIAHVDAGTPTTLLLHGGHDQLVKSENMRMLAERLSEAGVKHKTLFIPYAQHGFDYNFNGWGAQISQPVILDFIMRNTLPG